MEQKKTLTEIYRECKHEQELKQQLEYLRDTTELFKKQPAKEIKKASDTPAIIGLSLFLMAFFGFCVFVL